MFYIRNLLTGDEFSFHSKRALLSYWRWKIQIRDCLSTTTFDFSELNITGKDTVYGITKSIPVMYGCIQMYNHEYGWRLKTYQVLDAYQRSCDIREWMQEQNEVLAETYPSWMPPKGRPQKIRFRNGPVDYISKHPHANSQLPAFTKQRLEIYHNDFSLDFEDDLLRFTPVIDHSRPRKLNWTYKKEKVSDIHSWKRASKNRSQWGRHMERAPEESVKSGIVRGLEEETMSEANQDLQEIRDAVREDILLNGESCYGLSAEMVILLIEQMHPAVEEITQAIASCIRDGQSFDDAFGYETERFFSTKIPE